MDALTVVLRRSILLWTSILVLASVPAAALSPELCTSWESQSPLPKPLERHAVAQGTGWVYVLGGCTASGPSNNCVVPLEDAVYAAPLSAAGELGAWRAVRPLPSPRERHNAVLLNNRLYVLGGSGPGGEVNEVWVAGVRSDGDLEPWARTTDLPAPTAGAGSTGFDGGIYLLGGDSNGTRRADVAVSSAAGDGSLTPWAGTSALPGGRMELGTAVLQGYLYALGGWQSGSLADVVRAPLQSNGTLGVWSSAEPLPSARSTAAAVASPHRIYVIAGVRDGTAPDSNTISAGMDDSGILGSWRDELPLPGGVRYPQAFMAQDFLFVLGGGGSAGPVATVQRVRIGTDGVLGACPEPKVPEVAFSCASTTPSLNRGPLWLATALVVFGRRWRWAPPR